MLTRSFRCLLLIGLYLIIETSSYYIKNIFKENRPLESCASGYGFPSGHSGISISILTFLILLKYNVRLEKNKNQLVNFNIVFNK